MSDATQSRLRVVVEGGPLTDARATAGIGRYVRSLAAALAGIGDLDVELATPRREARSERYPLRFLHSSRAAVAAARSRRPDLVHATATEPVLGWPLQRQVVTVHDVIPWTSRAHGGGRSWGPYWGVQGWRLRRCAAIVVPSRRVAAEAAPALRLDSERISVVAEGVDSVFSSIPGIDDGERRQRLHVTTAPYVLWTGSMLAPDPRKRLDDLLQAVAAVRREIREVELVLAGRQGAEAARLAEKAQEVGVPLVQPGFVSDEDLAALLRGAAAVAVPSLSEGFGLPVLEALASGAPLVATRVGDIAEIAGDAALLVAPEDPRALAEGLSAVISSEPIAARLKAEGPARAAPYTWDRAARETAAVYRRALAR